MRIFICVLAVLGSLLGWLPSALTAEQPRSDFAGLADEYLTQIRPILRHYCLNCHSVTAQAGGLDLQRFATLAEVRRDTKTWLRVGEMLDSGEMPPESAKQPIPERRKKLREWLSRYIRAEALANAGDPGPVVLRRLNNAEYTYTIRDLTRVDLDPVREFPADSAAGEGFTNTGNALVMSPSLLRKYLDAAKEVARHAVLLPDGFRFSLHTTRRDWTDEILTQIREFYGSFAETIDFGIGEDVGNVEVHRETRIGLAGRLPLEKYFAATLTERDALATGSKTIEAVARERGLSAKYLNTLWVSLSGSTPSLLLDDIRSRWREAKPGDADALAENVAAWQGGLWKFSPVGLIGRKGGPLRWMEPVNPLLTQQAVRFPMSEELCEDEVVVISLVARDAGDGDDHDFVVWQEPRLVAPGRPDIYLRDVRRLYGATELVRTPNAPAKAMQWGLDPEMFGKHPKGKTISATSLFVRVPSVVKIRLPGYLAAGRELLTTAVLDREMGGEGSAQVHVITGNQTANSGLIPSKVTVRFSESPTLFSDHRDVSFEHVFLAAKDSIKWRRFQSAFNEFRSVFPAALCFNQIVPIDEIISLTLFYREDDHLVRLMLDDAQKSRLDRLWEELHYVSQSPLLQSTALDLLLEVLEGNGLEDRSQLEAVKLLRLPFDQRATAFKDELVVHEQRQIKAVGDFAAQAYRRPLTEVETEELYRLYRQLRGQNLSHDNAFRLVLARVLVSPAFLYRLEKTPFKTSAAMISNWELANRLSYFLWSSQPDEELQAVAAAGSLHTPEVLVNQVRRMLSDKRVQRLATEFGTQWLHIYGFDKLTEKSEKYFPEFLELRGDMYEEPIRFLTDLFQNDESLLSLLNADHTFVNKRLAAFYGIEGIKNAEWRRVDGVRRYGRGGILGFAATLAKQSGASRTSPILRGNWISEVLLGEKLPRPPPEVPQLPSDETATDGLTMRELVARHTNVSQCASCHQRIDPFGFALEGFDAIGRRRGSDLAGRPIDTQVELPDGAEVSGLTGLRDYLLEARRDAFLDQFCRKFLGYALGREVQLSDEPLLSTMQQQLARNEYRFSTVVEMITKSRQFREIRGKPERFSE